VATESNEIRGQLSIGLPDGTTQIVALNSGRYDLGRAETNRLPFPNIQGVSRRHAAFERNGSSWFVRDLGSTNGTFLNSRRVSEPHALKPNDTLTVGQLTIVFSETQAAPIESTVVFDKQGEEERTQTIEVTLDAVLNEDREFQNNPHMRALVKAGRELCGHTSLDELFEVIMNLSFDAVGGARGALITIEQGELVVRASKGKGFNISSHVRNLVLKEGRSLLVRDAQTDRDLAARQSIMQEQIRGILAVPLQTEHHIIGLIYLDSPLIVKEFTRADLNVLTVLANIAAIRIDQARLAEIEQAEKLHSKELEHAALIQRSMLPCDIPPFPNRKDFELHASMSPAREIGGDLFDFFLLDHDHLAFAIGDVSGKGAPAALFMAVTRTLLRATAQNRKGPAECFNYMNATLCENNSSGMFVTLFYGVLNTATGDLVFANAGHNFPYLFSPEGNIRKISEKGGPMLGVFEGVNYRTLAARIQPGEGILLYTDGVTEAVNRGNEFFGDDRLEDYLSRQASGSAQALVDGLQETVKTFAKGKPQADDITVLVLRFGGP
jgi:sigma-B regulation protein RsbU (phosphoserine phosphatase)